MIKHLMAVAPYHATPSNIIIAEVGAGFMDTGDDV